jgi:hypothetical protein
MRAAAAGAWDQTAARSQTSRVGIFLPILHVHEAERDHEFFRVIALQRPRVLLLERDFR